MSDECTDKGMAAHVAEFDEAFPEEAAEEARSIAARSTVTHGDVERAIAEMRKARGT
ncbi:hypothetical protein [Streptomyces sp. 6N223]|uniref:hypothetical protein n=1 Tax=Streptomyces sp. 6N223 TaxID=3457412 RepID=UPI003FD346F7